MATRIYGRAPATPDQLLVSKRHVQPSEIWLKSILFFSFFGHIGSLTVKIAFLSRGLSTTVKGGVKPVHCGGVKAGH